MPFGAGGEFVGGASAPASGAAATGTFVKQSQTPAAGTALINGTQTILSWTTPNDGNLHMFTYQMLLDVTSDETGGAIFLTFTTGGIAVNSAQSLGGQPAGSSNIQAASGQADPNTTVTIHQTGALTAGAAKVFATLLGE